MGSVAGRRSFLVAFTALALLTACSGGDEPAAEPTSSAAATVTTTAPATSEPSAPASTTRATAPPRSDPVPATDPPATTLPAPASTIPDLFPDAVPVVIDTDANNELDDQHALAYALFRPDLFDVVAITINATSNGGSVAAHAAEAERVIALADRTGTVPVFAGADGTFDQIRPDLADPEHDGHAAVDALIASVRADGAVVVVPIGKLTNVALALAKAPDIAAGLRVVWLGSNYPLGGGEYNLDNDPGALRYVLDEGVDAGLEFEIATVRPGDPTGTAAVQLTIEEATERLPGLGPVVDPPVIGRSGQRHSTFGDYAAGLFRGAVPFGDPPSRSLFDLAGVAIVAEPSWARPVVVRAPSFVDGQFVERPDRPATIVYWEQFDGNAIIEDLFSTLAVVTP